jgi:hypothetical protein
LYYVSAEDSEMGNGRTSLSAEASASNASRSAASSSLKRSCSSPMRSASSSRAYTYLPRCSISSFAAPSSASLSSASCSRCASVASNFAWRSLVLASSSVMLRRSSLASFSRSARPYNMVEMKHRKEEKRQEKHTSLSSST